MTKQYSKYEHENALKDMETLLKESKNILGLYSLGLLCRKLFVLTRGLMETEIKEGWDVTNSDLVLHYFDQSAQHAAVRAEINPASLQEDVLNILLPFLAELPVPEEPVSSEIIVPA